ncbi:hypothetical protein, partial [Runella zeae]|uniref:hypothetical protein n=1 Tax=Runella zeae TaxID=94255 RepID=UPI002357A692
MILIAFFPRRQLKLNFGNRKMGDFGLKTICLFSVYPLWKKICIMSYEIIRYILLKVDIFGVWVKPGANQIVA